MENNDKQMGIRLFRLFFIAICVSTYFFAQLKLIEGQPAINPIVIPDIIPNIKPGVILKPDVIKDNPDVIDIKTKNPEAKYPSTYLVTAPSVVRPDLPYAVSVCLLKKLTPSGAGINFVLKILDSENKTIASKTQLISQNGANIGKTQTVTISKIPSNNLTDGQIYYVYVLGEANSKKLFEDRKEIRSNSKSVSIFVQTDKAIYSPSDTVRYRVIVTNPDLSPYNQTINVHVEDPNQNRITDAQDVKLIKGVYEDKFQLSSEPPLGTWTITVATFNGDVTSTKQFDVDHYVLPKFDVNINLPPFITFDDDLIVGIDSKYTYGQGVQGVVKVILSDSFFGGPIPFPRPIPIDGPIGIAERKAPIDGGIIGPIPPRANSIEKTSKLNSKGEVVLTFSAEELKKHLYSSTAYPDTISITAIVTESLTGIMRNDTSQITVYTVPVKLTIDKQGDSFKPGLSFLIVLALKQMDDTPAKPSLPRRVSVDITYTDISGNSIGEFKQILNLTSDGTLTLQLHPPQNAKSLDVEAKYDLSGKDNFTNSEITASTFVNAAESPSNSYLQLSSQTNTPKNSTVGESVQFNVKITEKLASITYQVIARGVVVLTKDLSINSSTAVISFIVTNEMTPKAHLIAYGIRPENQEILVDAIDFVCNGLFRNKVSISSNKAKVEPGDPIKFEIEAAPDSFIGVMAVDQSVILLKSGNDITRDLVETDIAQYDTTSNGGGIIFRPFWFPWWPIGGQDASQIFDNCGLVVLTNAYLYNAPNFRRPWPIFEKAVDGLQNAVPAPAPPTPNGGGSSSPTAPKVRKYFPETWIWTEKLQSTNNSNVTTYQAKAPDTITSWVLSAFAINNDKGLGIADTLKLTVFRRFFISLNLPYSVKQGEKFALQVLISNYMKNEQNVLVTLTYESGIGFEFLDSNGKEINPKNVIKKGYNIRKITVPGGGVTKAVYFPIVLTKVGMIKLSIVAQGSEIGDAIEQYLRVEPDGYRVNVNVPLVIDLTKSKQFNKTIKFKWPKDFIQGSRHASFDVIGDIMGPVLATTEKLIQMPYGCGEQNMITMVPNIVELLYLLATHRNEPALEEKAIGYIATGYQHELQYVHPDGSFSAFGTSDTNGSTFLTAFVVRSFKQAKQFVYIDDKILTKSIAFLVAQQTKDGEFIENGQIIDTGIQSGAGSGIALTAYVFIAMLEKPNGVKNVLALKYLENHLNDVKNAPYPLALITYALHLANSTKKALALKYLEALKIENDGNVHWNSNLGPIGGGFVDLVDDDSRAHPADIETTSYALLVYVLRGDIQASLPIVRWLTSQRNSLGGWGTTQDTVVGLQGLGAYAEKVYSPKFDLSIKLKNGKDSHDFSVNAANSIVLQQFELSEYDQEVEIEASGSGVAFAQLQYSYYRPVKRGDFPYYCTIKLDEQTSGNQFQLQICCNYTRSGNSGMSLLQVGTLSGYGFDENEAQKLTDNKGLQRVELDNSGTTVYIYFNSIGSESVCLILHSYLQFEVYNQQPANLLIASYYAPAEKYEKTYSLISKPNVTFPSIDENDDGSDQTTAAPRRHRKRYCVR